MALNLQAYIICVFSLFLVSASLVLNILFVFTIVLLNDVCSIHHLSDLCIRHYKCFYYEIMRPDQILYQCWWDVILPANPRMSTLWAMPASRVHCAGSHAQPPIWWYPGYHCYDLALHQAVSRGNSSKYNHDDVIKWKHSCKNQRKHQSSASRDRTNGQLRGYFLWYVPE